MTTNERASRGSSRLALASTSPRRRALLEEAGIAFVAVDPGLSDAREEELARAWTAAGFAPAQIAQHLAVAKAMAAERRVPPGTTRVLAADTVVVLGDEALGKPRDAADARAMIERLSGKTHEVVTGVALLDLPTGKLEVGSESTRVRFRSLDAKALDAFLASGAWAGKAGGYGVQDDAAAPLVERVEGSRSNVIGLPLERVQALLATFGKAAAAGKTATVVGLALALSLLTGCPETKSGSLVASPTPGSGPPVVTPPRDPAQSPPPATQPTPSPGGGQVKVPFVPRIDEGLPQSGLPERTLEIGGRKVTVELATTDAQRHVGLMWRTSMPDDHGMLFVYPEDDKRFHSFWMKNTKIGLTAAFLADDGSIVNLEDMEPDTEASHPAHAPVRLVLEMNHGWFKIHGIEPKAVVKGAAEALSLGE